MIFERWMTLLILSIFLVLCFFITPLYALAQLYKVTNVFETETLNVRQGANAKTPILFSLPYNAKKITIIQRKAKSTWVKIRLPASRIVGWVNGRYLKPYTNTLPKAYSCSGTEPFWRVEMNTQTKKIEAHILSASNAYFNVPMLLNTHAMNSPKESRIITGKNAKHAITAFIVEGSCNDGMSDKVFDYQITGLLDNKAYSGCCRAIERSVIKY